MGLATAQKYAKAEPASLSPRDVPTASRSLELECTALAASNAFAESTPPHQDRLPAPPLNGPTMCAVIQPP
jgi:hypothetical protein